MNKEIKPTRMRRTFAGAGQPTTANVHPDQVAEFEAAGWEIAEDPEAKAREEAEARSRARAEAEAEARARAEAEAEAAAKKQFEQKPGKK
jgi:hypothetical protein